MNSWLKEYVVYDTWNDDVCVMLEPLWKIANHFRLTRTYLIDCARLKKKFKRRYLIEKVEE